MRAMFSTRSIVRLPFALALGALLGSPVPTLGADRGKDGKGLVGPWRVEVTLRDCTTHAPIGTIRSLVTFHGDGTISETPELGTFAPGQRSDGHGTWRRTGRTYLQKMVALIQFTTPPNLPGTPTFDPTQPITPGFEEGWQTVSHVVELTGSGLRSAGTNAFYRSNGERYREGCSTAVAVPFR